MSQDLLIIHILCKRRFKHFERKPNLSAFVNRSKDFKQIHRLLQERSLYLDSVYTARFIPQSNKHHRTDERRKLWPRCKAKSMNATPVEKLGEH